MDLRKKMAIGIGAVTLSALSLFGCVDSKEKRHEDCLDKLKVLVTSSDMDGDGDLDLTLSLQYNNNGSILYFFENDGEGNFTTAYLSDFE